MNKTGTRRPAKLLLAGAAALVLSHTAIAGEKTGESRDRLGCDNPRACAASVEHERARRDMIDAHNQRLDQVKAIGERIATQPPLNLNVPVYQP